MGTEETRTITRAEPVTIYTALDKFATRECTGISTDSLSSLQAIRHRYTHQGPSSPHNYNHHLLLLSGVMDLLEERRRRGFQTSFRKIRTRTNIRGSNNTDTAATLAVTQYDSLPESQIYKK